MVPLNLVLTFFVFGVILTSIALLVLIKSLYNYNKYSDFFYSEKDIKIHYLQKHIKTLETKITKLQQENEQITKTILKRIEI